MEELESTIEGEVPQQPDAAAPDQPEAAAPSQADTAAPERAEAGALDKPEPDVPHQPEVTPPDPPEAASPALTETAPDPAAESAAERSLETAAEPPEPAAPDPAAPVPVEELLSPETGAPALAPMEDAQLMAVLEAVIYVAEEPLTLAQIAAAIAQPQDRVDAVLRQLIAELDQPEHGIAIREVAGGFKMATKAEHHEAVRSFVKSLKPPMKLSLPALETLAVIAYKQPVTAPEIMEIRGVQGAGVLKTLLDRKLIAVAGRKNVIGKPILYKTTRDFLIQFGLNDVNELPSLKEFEDIRRMAFADSETSGPVAVPETAPQDAPEPTPEREP